MANKLDFFISYTSADQGWAEWIAWVLEEGGYHVRIQAWDFPAGSNFVEEMQRAATEAERTIAVLSPEYLSSPYARSEWEAAFTQDPTGSARKLIPVRVKEVDLTGLHKGIVYIDLVGLNQEDARRQLLKRVREGRAKPENAPPFPGRGVATGKPSAPRARTVQGTGSSHTYSPKIKKQFTDRDRRQFVKHTLEVIRDHFRAGLDALHAQHPEIEAELEEIHATKFVAEIFVHGKRRNRCKIWLGSLGGRLDSIAYHEGHSGIDDDNTLSEQLSVDADGNRLSLSPLFGAMHGVGNDVKMTAEQAADHLWRRFVAPLEW